MATGFGPFVRGVLNTVVVEVITPHFVVHVVSEVTAAALTEFTRVEGSAKVVDANTGSVGNIVVS